VTPIAARDDADGISAATEYALLPDGAPSAGNARDVGSFRFDDLRSAASHHPPCRGYGNRPNAFDPARVPRFRVAAFQCLRRHNHIDDGLGRRVLAHERTDSVGRVRLQALHRPAGTTFIDEPVGSGIHKRQERRSIVGGEHAFDAHRSIALRPVSEEPGPTDPLRRIPIAGRGRNHVAAALAQRLDRFLFGELHQRLDGRRINRTGAACRDEALELPKRFDQRDCVISTETHWVQ
jgi:hypothetical protein